MKEEIPPVLQYQILQLALDLPANKFSWFRLQVMKFYLFHLISIESHLSLYSVLMFLTGCCKFRIIVWREVCLLPTSENVCVQQQQPPELHHTEAHS